MIGTLEFVARSDWATILPAYARCVRIVRDLKETLPLDIATDGDPYTQVLHAAYEAAQTAIGPQSSIEAFFSALAPLIPAIQTFFDKVLVMAKEPPVRRNRLALLQAIRKILVQMADYSQVVVEGEKAGAAHTEPE